MKGWERLWSGRRAVAEVCDACLTALLPNDPRVVLADDDGHVVTLCPGDYIRRLDAAVPKVWPASNTLRRRVRR